MVTVGYLYVAFVICSLPFYANGFITSTYVSYRMRISSEISMGLQEKMLVKGGSVVALVTPMKVDNSIDYDQLTDLLKWHAEQGTDGVVVLGTTGEASLISIEERTKIIQTSVRAVKGVLPIIIGTGSVDTLKAIALSKHALEHGADASLIITPYYVKPPHEH